MLGVIGGWSINVIDGPAFELTVLSALWGLQLYRLGAIICCCHIRFLCFNKLGHDLVQFVHGPYAAAFFELLNDFWLLHDGDAAAAGVEDL